MSSTDEVETDTSHDEEHKPHGTVFLMIMFLLVIIAMWVWMFLTLLERG